MTERTRTWSPVGEVADLLTVARLPLAVAITAVLRVGDALAAATVLLCVAWITDFLDGRLARRSGGSSRLGPLDPLFDALVGVGVTAGLVAAGRAGAYPWLAVVLVLLALFVLTGNVSLGMALQAVGYGLLIVELAADAPEVLWVMGATIGLIGVADARRFAEVVLPSFFAGLGLSGRSHRKGPHA
jgi:phosphatidylglycerophosphate synthase